MNRTRSLFSAILFALVISGCSPPTLLDPLPEDATQAEKLKHHAQETVLQGTRALLVAQILLDKEVESGVLSKAELAPTQKVLREVRLKLVAANNAIESGRIAEALNSGLDAKVLAVQAEKFLAKRISERRRP